MPAPRSTAKRAGQPCIDMKGRVYDPRVGQFLTPDPLVVSPFASQAYNRYAYVLNNPLRYIDPTGFQSCDSVSCGGGGGSGEWFGPSLGSEGAGSFPLGPASFAPTFSDVGGASTEGSGGTSGMDVEATFGERALYLGAGTSYAIGKGVLLVCTATTVCTAVVVAVAVVGGTAYVVHDLFFDGGAEQIVNAFTEFKTKEDASSSVKHFAALSASGGSETECRHRESRKNFVRAEAHCQAS